MIFDMEKVTKQQENRGGKRKGAGRPSKFSFGEKTEVVSFRAPASKVQTIKEVIFNVLLLYVKKH